MELSYILLEALQPQNAVLINFTLHKFTGKKDGYNDV